MAVVETNRTEHVLQVAVKAMDLAKYTLQITRNEKIFTLEYKGVVTDKIVSDATDIYRWIWKANNIRVKDHSSWERRSALQILAKELCNDMIALINLAKPIFHLKTKRVKYWVEKIVEVRMLIEKWHERDAERYKNYNGT